MDFDKAYELIGGLSKPSKMPWYSWSTPASKCQTGGKLQQKAGSVCEGCYAMKGFYHMPNVKNAMDRRFAAITHPDFVEAFVTVLDAFHKSSKTGENRFRWHDSGDIQSVDHMNRINEIALRLPHIRFWLPTKEASIVGHWLKRHPAGFAPNLVVRLSHPMIGQTFTKAPSDLPFSTVGFTGKGVKQCPAMAKQGNKCLDCDTCWKRTVKAVNYPLH